MFNKRLRELRIKKQYTQQQFADKLSIGLRSYQKYEEGSREPSLMSIVKIADILDTSIDYLLCRDDFLKSHGVFFDE